MRKEEKASAPSAPSAPASTPAAAQAPAPTESKFTTVIQESDTRSYSVVNPDNSSSGNYRLIYKVKINNKSDDNPEPKRTFWGSHLD